MGAWIETVLNWLVYLSENVAPYVGAWIETEIYNYCLMCFRVAPYVGAWIETDNRHGRGQPVPSLPTWERGLKRKEGDAFLNAYESRSLRGSVD